jgi:tetratricopeptide (TPR) repeat protein
LSAFPASYALELHRWKDAAALQPISDTPAEIQSITYWARAIGSARDGNRSQARRDIDQLKKIHDKLIADKKSEEAENVESSRQEALAWLKHAQHKDEEAVKLLRSLAEHEEAVGEESTGIPAREMLAEILLDSKHPEQALAEYQTDLKFAPNRFNGLYGAARAAELAGKADQAKAYYAQLLKNCEGSTSGRPELAESKRVLAGE